STQGRRNSQASGAGAERSMWHLHIQREPGRRAPTSCTGCGSCAKTRSSQSSSVRRFSSVVSRKTSASSRVMLSGSPCSALWSFLVTAQNASPPRITSHRRRQLALTELALEPAGEVVLLRAVAQPGLEQVIGDGSAAHHGQRLRELGQGGRPMAGGEHEGDRIHEVELLSGRRRAQRLAWLEVAFDDGHDPVAQLAEVVEAHGVDGREPLAELLLLQGVGHPEGEVVGRLGGEILVL